MKTLDSGQTALVASSSLAVVHLIKLTTYSDREQSTIDETFYISRRAELYDYGNTGTDQFFKPWLESLGALRSSMIHVASGTTSGLMPKTLDIDLVNAEYGGTRVAALLQATTLEGADIEVAELLVPAQSGDWIHDLTSYTGDEHTVIFRGEVSRALINNTRVTLACATKMPSYKWPAVFDDSAGAPKDVGFRYPVVFGSDVQVIAPAIQVGPVLTLSEAGGLDNSETGVKDFNGIDSRISTDPADWVFLRIGLEDISAHYESATELDLVTRGWDSTTPAAHAEGDAVQAYFYTDVVFVASVLPNATITKVEYRHPQTGELVKLPASYYTIDLEYYDGTQTVTAVTFTQNQFQLLLTLTGASAGTIADIELFVTMDGLDVPDVFSVGESYDVDSGWSAAFCSTALETTTPDPYEGTGYRSMTLDMDDMGVATFTSDDAGDWAASNASDSAQAGEGHREGTGCIEADADGAAEATVYYTAAAAFDHEDPADGGGRRLLMFDFKIKKGGSTGTVVFDWGSDSSNYYQVGFNVSQFTEDTWFTIFIDWLNDGTDTTGSPVQGDMDYFRCTFNRATGDTNCKVYLDNFKAVPIYHIIQRNSMGGVDMDAVNEVYRLAFHLETRDFEPDRVESGDEAVAFNISCIISDEVETGTTIPSVLRTLTFDENILKLDKWVDLNAVSVIDTGVPDCSIVETLRHRLTAKLHGAYDRDPIFVLNIDSLRWNDEALNTYPDPIGTLIDEPADVCRYWLDQIGGNTIHEASMTASDTNLGTNVLAVDLRSLGTDHYSVLDALGVICRGNFVPEETATGVQWKLLTAESDYEWPAASRTLDQFNDNDLAEAGRDRKAELFSARSFLYDYRVGIDAFTKMIRVSSDDNQSGGKVPAATVTAAVADFGEAEAEPMYLLGVGEEATAQELVGYYYKESARLASLFVIENLSWSQGYDLVLGDIVVFVRPWMAGTVKARVIELTKSFRTQQVEVRCVEVA